MCIVNANRPSVVHLKLLVMIRLYSIQKQKWQYYLKSVQ